MELSIVGGSAFTLGFALTGIRRIEETEENPALAFRKVMQDANVGIIITDEPTLNQLDEHTREDVERSVKPVVVVLSADMAQDSLRKLIKKSIGVDLLKE